MTRPAEDTVRKLRELVARTFHENLAERVGSDTVLEELAPSDMDLVLLSTAIDHEFRIYLPLAAVRELVAGGVTVRDLAVCIDRLRAQVEEVA